MDKIINGKLTKKKKIFLVSIRKMITNKINDVGEKLSMFQFMST